MNRPLCSLALLVLAGTAGAMPFAPFDVRAAGMGGTGVASAKAASAALFNPAMLSAERDEDDFQFSLGAGAEYADASNMFDQTDALTKHFDALNQALSANDLPAVQTETQETARRLIAINHDNVFLGGGAGLGVGVPSSRLGVGVAVSTNAYADVSPTIDPADLAALQSIHDIAGGSPGTLPASFAPGSTAAATGALVSSIGIALSHRLELANGGILALGATPRSISVTSYFYEKSVDSFDSGDITDTRYQKEGNHFDLDVGAVFRPSADSKWQYGLAAMNLANTAYDTVSSPYSPPRHVPINTQVRAGVAHMTTRTTLAVDLDITENEGIATNTETQFLSLGAEYDLKYLQLRAGYRANLANSDVGDVATLGIGLGPLDISAMAGDGTLGGFVQLGFGW